MASRPSLAFNMHRDSIRRTVLAHHVLNPRVFGSVASGNDTEQSDLDLLVDATPATGLLDLAALELELEALLGCPVHVTTTGSLREPLRKRVLAEALPL